MNDTDNTLSAEMQAVFAVFELHGRLQERADQIKTDPPLGPSETLLMFYLNGPLRMGQVAGMLRCLPSSATAIVDGLEKKGMVLRAPAPTDRRVSLLHLTNPGRRVRQQLLAEMDDIFRDSSGLGQDGTTALLQLLRGGG